MSKAGILACDETGKMPVLQVPPEAATMNVAFLPPMSGLASNETRLDPGAINVRLGEGRTAEVLRNLCYLILTTEGGENRWRAGSKACLASSSTNPHTFRNGERL
ncbi:MAG: hypothetical protein ACE5GO_12715 [Anaerolineales bacterium]